MYFRGSKKAEWMTDSLCTSEGSKVSKSAPSCSRNRIASNMRGTSSCPKLTVKYGEMNFVVFVKG
jgi:hypothetical protein